MSEVLILVEDHFEEMEALYPYYRMKEAGHSVTVAGPEARTYHGKYGYPLEAGKAAKGINVKKFSAVIIPGGQAPDRLRTNAFMVRIVKDAVRNGLVVASICHGAQMLIEADVLRGRRATCYVSVKTDVINAGASYEDSEVVVDGRLVTSRRPGDLPAFCREILKQL